MSYGINHITVSHVHAVGRHLWEEEKEEQPTLLLPLLQPPLREGQQLLSLQLLQGHGLPPLQVLLPPQLGER